MATLYWYGGSGDWTDYTNHWSTNSGNSPAAPAGAAPTSADDVVFDSASHSGAYTVTVNATANCQNFTMGAPASGAVTWAGSSSINIYGNINLTGGSVGITNSYTGMITLKATSGTKTMNFNGVALGGALNFNGIGGTFQLSSNLTTSGSLLRTNGTFDANGKTVTQTGIYSYIYYDFTGSNSFYNYTRTGAADPRSWLKLMGDITVTNELRLDGDSATNRLLILSSTMGVQRTITAAILNADYVDFQDIKGAGAADWDLSAISGKSGDCGGNSGITFTPATNCYWVHGANASYPWSSSLWFTTSGGAVAARIPLPQDSAIFDASSFSADGKTVTVDVPRLPGTTFADVDQAFSFTLTNDVSFFGSLVMIANMTFSAGAQICTFEGRGSYVLNSIGQTFNGTINFNAPGGTMTLNSNLETSSYIGLLNGGLLANNYDVTALYLASNDTTVRTLTMGSGTWTMTGGTNVWVVISTNLTFNANTSLIKLTGTLTGTRTFFGGNLTYHDFWNATSGAYAITIDGSNTFDNFKINAGRQVNFDSSETQTINVLDASGTAGNLTILRNASALSTATLKKAGGGIISCDYMDVGGIVGTAAGVWYMGANSTNSGTNTDVYFTAAPNASSFFGVFDYIH